MLRITAMMSLLLATLAGPALADTKDKRATAQTPSEQILSILINRGYRILEDERTWLGRQRIIAERDGTRRELVFHPGTGEILRNYSVRIEMAGRCTGPVTAEVLVPRSPASASRQDPARAKPLAARRG